MTILDNPLDQLVSADIKMLKVNSIAGILTMNYKRILHGKTLQSTAD